MTDLEQSLRETIRKIVREEVEAALAEIACGGPPSFVRRYPVGSTTRSGVVYAVALIPEVAPYRVKIGFTLDAIESRLSKFKTTCPTAIALGAWSADFEHERVILEKLAGRIGRSEVFVVHDVEAMLVQIDRILGAS